MITDYYIPPKEVVKTSAIYYNVEYKKIADISINKKLQKQKPTNKDYEICAKTIKEIFVDGFQWHDIADVMKLSIQYLNNFFLCQMKIKGREFWQFLILL